MQLLCVIPVAGGHSNSGHSTIDGNGYVINLAKMEAIRVSSDQVDIQAGVRWGDVYELLDKLNSQQLIMGGMCPIVGVGGYTLGGGYSVLSRKYGLAIDNLMSMRMVTADGSKVVFINETTNSELFWALRGGGGGNFGVVTEFSFRTHTVAYQNYTLVEFSFEAGMKSREALNTVGQLNSHLPREMYLDMLITSNKELSIWCIYLGSYDEAQKHLDPLIDLASHIHSLNFASYYSLMSRVSAGRGMTMQTSELPMLIRGCILKNMDDATVDVLFSLDMPNQCVIAFMHLGGAIADIRPGDTAYVHRQGEFEVYSPCLYQDKEEEAQVFSFEDHFYTLLNSGGHCYGSYVNDMDEYLPQWQDVYYGDNYPKLLEVKEKWNPLGVSHFHFVQEIGSDYSPN